MIKTFTLNFILLTCILPSFAQSWVTQTSGTTTDIWSVSFANMNAGWASGSSGLILHTSDGGTNWTSQQSGVTGNLRNIFFVNDTLGWTTGDAGVILNTIDGGKKWT